MRTASLLLLTFSPADNCVFLKFDVIVSLINSFYLIQGHVNPFAPEPRATARADPRPFYPL